MTTYEEALADGRRVQARTRGGVAIVVESRLNRDSRTHWFGFRFAVNEPVFIGREIENEDGSIHVIRAIVQ